MIRAFLFLAVFLFIIFINPLVVFSEQLTVNAQISTNSTQTSVFDKAGDWLATIGKSPEEKTRILEERKLKRREMSEIESYKKKLQEGTEKVKEKAEIEVKAAREKAEREMGKVKEKAEKQIGQVQEIAQKRIQDAQSKAAGEIEAYKRKIKNEADKTMGDTKGFVSDLMK